jgi:hypothetical protein
MSLECLSVSDVIRMASRRSCSRQSAESVHHSRLRFELSNVPMSRRVGPQGSTAHVKTGPRLCISQQGQDTRISCPLAGFSYHAEHALRLSLANKGHDNSRSAHLQCLSELVEFLQIVRGQI